MILKVNGPHGVNWTVSNQSERSEGVKVDGLRNKTEIIRAHIFKIDPIIILWPIFNDLYSLIAPEVQTF